MEDVRNWRVSDPVENPLGTFLKDHVVDAVDPLVVTPTLYAEQFIQRCYHSYTKNIFLNKVPFSIMFYFINDTGLSLFEIEKKCANILSGKERIPDEWKGLMPVLFRGISGHILKRLPEVNLFLSSDLFFNEEMMENNWPANRITHLLPPFYP